jgi:hypothetical protein
VVRLLSDGEVRVRSRLGRVSVGLFLLTAACSRDSAASGNAQGDPARTRSAAGAPQVVDRQGGIVQGDAAAAAQERSPPSGRRELGAKVDLQPLSGSEMRGAGKLHERGEDVAIALEVQHAKPGASRVAVRESGGCPTQDAQAKISAAAAVARETGLGTLLIDERGRGTLEVTLQQANLKTDGHGSLLGKALVIYRMLPPAQPGERAERPVACGQIAPG